MHSANTSHGSSLFRKLIRVLLTTCLAISGLAMVLPKSIQAAPDAPAGLGSMTTARVKHTATLLQNGKVLAVGGYNGSVINGSAELYSIAAGTWSPTGSISPARESHTATTLLNGKVLVVGGSNGTSALASTTLYDPAKGTWTASGNLAVARSQHTATLLADGSVLVVGGMVTNGAPAGAAERYDPKNGTWSHTVSMSEPTPRWGQTATLLSNGWVLIAGGEDETGALQSTELYNPVSNTWTNVNATLSKARLGHSATALPNGKVLVAGGDNYDDGFLNSAELFTFDETTPADSTWTAAGSMVVNSRSGHSATLLPNGNVLVAGGFGGDLNAPENPPHALTSIELYDPDASIPGLWSGAGNLESPRIIHTATLLPTGEVLLTGGKHEENYLASAEKIDPTTGVWTATSEMDTERSGHSATLLADGKVLVAGGTGQLGTLNLAEIYDPISGWTNANPMHSPRANHTATLLPNGKVLVAGGGSGTTFINDCELYDPQTGAWYDTGALHDPRANHTATLLRNGKVLVAGGLTNGSLYLKSAEVYDPDTGNWSLVTPLQNARRDHTATLLNDGTVLVTGGYDNGYLASSERYDITLNAWLPTASMVTKRGNHTATLLPNGQVLVAGGLNDGLTTSELYNPISGGWSSAAPMNSGHYSHSAKLLPNGKVLVVGGNDNITGPIPDCEVYDPITADWQSVAPMNTARQSFAAAVLSDGRILAVGGQNVDALKSAELYDIGQGFLPAWRPTIDSLPARIKAGQILTFSGTNFRGYQQIEASSGSTHESPSNYPLVQLRRPDNGQVAWLSPDPTLGFSATEFNSIPLSFAIGPVVVTVYVNGIPSQSEMIQIDPVKVFTPMVFK